jgi:two-component system, NtrC family, sensor kinase
MPMFRKDEVIGLFSLARTDPDPFTPGQIKIKLVQIFADQAAIAIENARLFKIVQRFVHYFLVTRVRWAELGRHQR